MKDFLNRLIHKNDYEEDAAKAKRKRNIAIALIIAAILFLAFGGGIGSGGGKKSDDEEIKLSGSNYDEEIAKMERELEEILSLIRGAGEVRVKIDVEKREERVVAKDTKTKNQNQINGEEGRNSTEIEESVVTYGQGGGETPLVLSEKGMRPSGVLVVASGAADERVKTELFEAVRTLYGLSAHRVTVVCSV